MASMKPEPSKHSLTFPHQHLLGIQGLSEQDIYALLDLAENAVEVSRQVEKKKAVLRGRTPIPAWTYWMPCPPYAERVASGEWLRP